MKRIIERIKAFLASISARIGNFWRRVIAFSDARIDPLIGRVKHVLTHNFIIRIEGLTLILLGKMRIAITRKRRDAFHGYLFIMLWLVGFLVFTLYPMFYSFYLSLNEAYYSLETGVVTTFIGVENYLNIARSQVLLPLFSTYLGKMVLSVPLIIVFSIMIAMLINQPIRLKGFWRTVFFLPVIISTGPVIGELANQDATSLPSLQDSNVLSFIGDNLGDWIANPLEALLTSMLLILWYAGIPILIFLAGLKKIDPAIYEAASIDGASPWDRFWKITLPSVKPLISVSIIYIVVTMSLFVEPDGILDRARTHMLVGAPDDNLWHGYGYAAAIAWVYFFLMVVIMSIFAGIMAYRRRER
jgi:ABC-type sugar transport system permease subunit